MWGLRMVANICSLTVYIHLLEFSTSDEDKFRRLHIWHTRLVWLCLFYGNLDKIAGAIICLIYGNLDKMFGAVIWSFWHCLCAYKGNYRTAFIRSNTVAWRDPILPCPGIVSPALHLVLYSFRNVSMLKVGLNLINSTSKQNVLVNQHWIFIKHYTLNKGTYANSIESDQGLYCVH